MVDFWQVFLTMPFININDLLFLLYLPSPKRKSALSRNTSIRRKTQSNPTTSRPNCTLGSPTLKHPNPQSICPKFWRSKKLSPLLMLKKSIKSTTSLMGKTRQNLASKWPLKDHRENMSSFLWAMITFHLSWKILQHMWLTSTELFITLKPMF